MTFAFEDNYGIVKPLDTLPKTYESIVKKSSNVSNDTGYIYSIFKNNTFEDCYSFEIHYGNNKAQFLYLDANNVNFTNIAPILFEFIDVNVVSWSRVHITITLDTSNSELTVAKCHLNGSLTSKSIEKPYLTNTAIQKYSVNKNDSENYWKECSVCGGKMTGKTPTSSSGSTNDIMMQWKYFHITTIYICLV